MGNSNSIEQFATTTAVQVHNGRPSEHDMPLWALSVIEFLPWETRYEILTLSKSWHRNTTTLAYYRFLCNRLSAECGVYVPAFPPSGESWRTLFYDLYKLRHLWVTKPMPSVPSEHRVLDKRSKISVFAKFRPAPKDASKDSKTKVLSAAEAGEHGITLPLHQKLAMIRMSHNIRSNRKALRLLTEEGSWFSAKWAALSDETDAVAAASSKMPDSNSIDDEVEADENSPQNKIKDTDATNKSFTTVEGRAQNRRLLALTAARRRQELAGLDGSLAAAAAASSSSSSKGNHQKMISKVHSLDPISGRVVMLTPDVGLREFAFDGVLSGTTSQSYAYDLCTKRLIMDLLNGFNATAIVYGQTGSGKTYSMFGKNDTANNSSIGGGPHDRDGKGMIPRACEELLAAVEHRRRFNQIDSELCISYVEVFGDTVSDLLRQGARCGHSKVAAQRYVLNGAAEHPVRSMEDIDHILRIGEAQKRKAATAMNERSTRAHSLFIVTLRQRKMPIFFPSSLEENAATGPSPAAEITLQTRLFLADLGGSEQVKKSQVEAGAHRLIPNVFADDNGHQQQQQQQFSVGFQKAERMREAVNINLGLLALKKCIEALNQKMPYVPYQDSKLTMLLSEGLGGNCKTSVIVCANMDTVHVSETIATLRFGERCARIDTCARNNATLLAGILADLDERITALENAILSKEKWEIREVHREDVLAEEGTLEKALGGTEVLKQTFVTGAEAERAALVVLLQQRQQFAGLSSGVGSNGNGSAGVFYDEEEEGNDEDNDGEEVRGEEEKEKKIKAVLLATAADSSMSSSASAASASSAAIKGTKQQQQQQKRSKKVLGFGRAFAEIYGFGDEYKAEDETDENNTRFAEAAVDESQLPTVLLQRKEKKRMAWADGKMGVTEDVSSESFQKSVRKANKRRAQLAYSGISA